MKWTWRYQMWKRRRWCKKTYHGIRVGAPWLAGIAATPDSPILIVACRYCYTVANIDHENRRVDF